MKLKLHGVHIDTLSQTLSLISHLRKFIVLRFTPSVLTIILQNGHSINLEPQVWCKLNATTLFDEIDIQSLRDNIVSLEINVDLLLQTLRNYDKANSDGLFIRLQRKDSDKQHGSSNGGGGNTAGRSAYLALFYVNINLNSNTFHHTFRIPIKILKSNPSLLQEPEHTNIGLVIRLPPQFLTMYKRLDKFKRTSSNETVTIRASKNHGGFLGFILEEEGKFRVTVSWNDRLEVQKPHNNQVDHDSLRETMHDAPGEQPENEEGGETDDMEIVVKLKDWQMASKLVSQCLSVLLLIGDKDCALVCSLDSDHGDCEIVYYINGIRMA